MSTGPEPADAPVAREPTVDEVDDEYSEVDPDDVTENAIDYFDDRPSTETEKREDDA